MWLRLQAPKAGQLAGWRDRGWMEDKMVLILSIDTFSKSAMPMEMFTPQTWSKSEKGRDKDREGVAINELQCLV